MEQYDRDGEHLKILGIVYYVNAGIAAFASLFGLLYLGLGILFASGVIPPDNGMRGDEAKVMAMVFIIIGAFLSGLCLLFALLHFLAGRWLRTDTHRTFCFVIGCLNLINMPYGTLLGIFTILVLNRESVKVRFGGVPPAAQEATQPLAQ